MIHAELKLAAPAGAGRQFVATTGSGHHLLIDDAAGGTGPKPIELVAVAHAGCTAFDVVNILRKKRQALAGYEVRIDAEQRSEPPSVFTLVHIHHLVYGDVDAKSVADAIHLSETKYCSVGAMVEKSARVETTFEVVPAPVPELVR